jgi:hypothetical protein
MKLIEFVYLFEEKTNMNNALKELKKYYQLVQTWI